MKKSTISRQQEILTAARSEFMREGYAGARMQSIANNIGVTKAMIHYYFKTKENLFKEVFRDTSEKLMQNLMDPLEKEMHMYQKIEQFIDDIIERFSQHPQLAGFIINELNKHPDLTQSIFMESYQYDASVFTEQIEKAASNYEIAPVDADQVIVNIFSLSVFPYGARGLIQTMFTTENENYNQFLANRREVVKDTVINWLAG